MSSPGEKTNRPRILIVDDEEVVLDLLQEILAIDKYQTRVLRDPREALELLKKEDFDIIISDFRMPWMTGEDFYRKAAALKPGIEKKFIFTSGEMDPVRKKEFIRKTGVEVIMKPFRMNEIRSKVKSLIAKRENA